MQLRALVTDDDALSPVIGVVLMVAVTVVLSAAVGAFVLDIGSQVTQKSPNVVVGYDFAVDGSGTEYVNLTHTGGDDVKSGNIEVFVNGTIAWNDGQQGSWAVGADDWAGGEITGGNQLVLQGGTADVSTGDSVQVIWRKGDSSSILSSKTVS
ncbi:type IV pilin [Haloarchaeobius sp. DYHT-AS-18]|uniref:type IV pilin n=1 Tax=Haloarchaeobius sp. DYHT-AS-18 TaxID=3446117 RepID=UPI003EBA7FF0